ncbi:MAG: phosphate ABC transporter permease PstA [Pseudomonadota bacterium]
MATIVPAGDTRDSDAIASNVSGFNQLIQANLLESVPEAADDRLVRRDLYGLVTRLAVLPVAHSVAQNPEYLGTRQPFSLALSDDLDLYLKGAITKRRWIDAGAPGRLGLSETGQYVLSDAGTAEFPILRALWEVPEDNRPGLIIRLGETWFSLDELSGASVIMTYLTGPIQTGEQAGTPFRAMVLSAPESKRVISDRQIAWITRLEEDGRISRGWNTTLLTNADSTYPELAGAAAAILGSFFTMLITAFFAIPIGILAAIYLEEFAPKNRLTDMIEVNINNLAAVPSIVFGLLGAVVFLNAFGMPRSVPFVGGLVLGLLVLPTVIIASRAALKSVPQSIRTAALGLGASKTQSIFHHVLPLAAPGIMTGSIIGMARALGETAPLLLIGMVAFVADVPSGPGDESTVLPVLIFKWSTGAERAWEPMTAAAIVILLIFLVLMNLAAVFLRRQFERRW